MFQFQVHLDFDYCLCFSSPISNFNRILARGPQKDPFGSETKKSIFAGKPTVVNLHSFPLFEGRTIAAVLQFTCRENKKSMFEEAIYFDRHSPTHIKVKNHTRLI
jgi:hypothetical protein